MVAAIRQAVSGQLQSFGRGVINNVAGNVKDMIGLGRDNSPGAAMQNQSNFYTKNLQYPLNVEGDPQQGHYMLFMINQRNGETKAAVNRSKNMDKINKTINKQFGNEGRKVQQGPPGFSGGGSQFVDTGGNPVKVKDTGAGTRAIDGAKGGNLYASSTTSTRLGTAIALYMPATVSTSYNMNYSDVEIGVMSSTITQLGGLLGDVFSGKGVTTGQFSSLIKTGETGLKRGILKGLDAVAPGIRAQAQISSGKILSNKMELSFTGVSRREFSFTFVFMPKSEQEAQVVEQIIHLFKFHAHGAWNGEVKTKADMGEDMVTVETAAEALGYEMTIPDTFDIQYMYQGNQNHFLNKISTCFLQSISVAYGGDRFVAYNPSESIHGGSSPPPQRTTLTLGFKEMEILDKNRIDQGY